MDEKPRHPAPWKWVDFMGGIYRLEDATGMQILFPVSGGIVFGSHEARELTGAAAEMEELLRWFVDQVGNIRPAHPNVYEAIRVLSRIAAARRMTKIDDANRTAK